MSTTVKWGSEQTLNPGHRTLVTLSDGRLFGIYEVNPGTSGSSSTLFGQFYGADGTQIGTAFVVDSLYQGAYRNAVAEVLDDGRFVVGWSGNNGGDGWGTNNVGYRILNADGTQSGPAVNLLNSNFTTVVEITAIGDGRFVFDGAGYVGTPNLVSNIGRVHQVFDADGSAVSQPNLVFGGSSVFANLPVATQPLSDGGYVSVGQVYTGGSGFVSSTQLLGRAFNSDGSPRGAEFEVSGTDHTRSDVQLEVLADGRMVAIWKATGPSDSPWGPGWSYSSDAELRGQVFYADGTKSGAEFVVNTTTEGLQDMPSLTALHDGRFLVAWQDFGVGSTPLANLQAFNPDGSKSGLEFSVTSPDSLSQSWPKLETLADGRVVLSWHSWEGSTLLNKFQMLDPRQGPVTLNGEVTADHLVGTRWADVINGGFGNDVLAGGNGNDTVYGEWGNDTLKGDAGNDRLYGGAGNDSLHGGVGSDELWAGDGNDTLDGGAGNDALIGGLGNDTYIVNSLLDLVIENANEGTDTVTSNNISLSLSNYAEVENASLTGSRLLNLTGSLGNNVLMGNVGANLIDGGAGNDTLNGGSGNDTLVGGLGTDSMTGGAGVDLFRFLTVSESVGSTATTRDVITDFQRGIDKIDLAAIDASLTLAGDQAFTFIGTAAFSGTGGAQVRYVGGILSGNVNGDLVADFQIQLVGSPAITATDIIL